MRKMKDSGIEWIGEIPEGWEVAKTLYALSMPITDGPHETPELFEDGIPFVSAEAVSCGNGRIDFSHIRGFISNDFYQECCKKYKPQLNDIYLIKSGATTGKVAIVDTDKIFTIWSPLAVYRCNTSIYNYRFLFYFIQSDGYQKQIENKWTWGTQQNIGMRTLEKLIICFPPLSEQERIADYLDEKCGRIDAAIEKQKQVIEKLQEYKRSLITQTVTKGLNPKAKMKDSGIEWIGEIPEGWEVRRLKTFTRVLRGGSPRPIEDFLTDDSNGLNWIKIGDTVKGSKYIDCVAQKIIPDGLNKTRQVFAGDLLLTNSMSFGEAYILNVDGCIHDGWVCLQDLKNVHKEYLYYLLISSFATTQFSLQVAGGVVQNLNVDKIGALICFLPPLSEQRQIADYLDERCASIDSVIAKKSALIEKLTEYKKSLIYETVTGKREI